MWARNICTYARIMQEKSGRKMIASARANPSINAMGSMDFGDETTADRAEADRSERITRKNKKEEQSKKQVRL